MSCPLSEFVLFIYVFLDHIRVPDYVFFPHCDQKLHLILTDVTLRDATTNLFPLKL